MVGLNPQYTLQDYLKKNISPKDIMLKAPCGVTIIPAASGVMDFIHYDAAQQQQLIKLIQQLEQ